MRIPPQGRLFEHSFMETVSGPKQPIRNKKPLRIVDLFGGGYFVGRGRPLIFLGGRSPLGIYGGTPRMIRSRDLIGEDDGASDPVAAVSPRQFIPREGCPEFYYCPND